ncbi:amidohydrolase family protein [Sphingopyxis panaciterrae]
MTRQFPLLALLAPALLLAPAARANETRAIVHAKLLTVSHGVIEDGTIVITDGKITAVGDAGTPVPASATIHDATGMTVYPGLIDSLNDDALSDGSLHGPTSIHNLPAGTPTPHIKAGDSVRLTQTISVNRLNGLLNAGVSPGSQGPEPGQASFIEYGDDASSMVLVPDAALVLNFGKGAKRTDTFPSTAFGIAGFFRKQLVALQDYRSGVGLRDAKGKMIGDPKFDAMIPFVDGKRPIIVYAQTDTQIGVALNIAEEFSLKIILAGAANIDKEIDRVARMKVPVIFGTVWDLPLPGQRFDTVYSAPGRLTDKGIRVALTTMGRSGGGSRNLPYAAGAAVAYGLSYDMALRAITLTPAELFGVSDRLGSLDVGKAANIVIANGDPLNVTTEVTQVFLNGKPIAMESFQTKLRDRYTKK